MSQFISTILIQRINDLEIPYAHLAGLDLTDPVIAANVADLVLAHTGVISPDEFGRADFTATGSYLKLFAVADADYAGTLVAGTTLAAALPASVTATEAHEWEDVATATKYALHFYSEDISAADSHTYPHFPDIMLGLNATTHFVDFFHRFGGL